MSDQLQYNHLNRRKSPAEDLPELEKYYEQNAEIHGIARAIADEAVFRHDDDIQQQDYQQYHQKLQQNAVQPHQIELSPREQAEHLTQHFIAKAISVNQEMYVFIFCFNYEQSLTILFSQLFWCSLRINFKQILEFKINFDVFTQNRFGNGNCGNVQSDQRYSDQDQAQDLAAGPSAGVLADPTIPVVYEDTEDTCGEGRDQFDNVNHSYYNKSKGKEQGLSPISAASSTDELRVLASNIF